MLQTRGYRHVTKTSGLVYWRHTGAHFIPRNNFANLGSFAKVSVPVRTVIPWFKSCYFIGLSINPSFSNSKYVARFVFLKLCLRVFQSVGYICSECQKKDWPNHKGQCKTKSPDVIGQPFIVSLPQSKLTYKTLSTAMESYARFSVSTFKTPLSPSSVHG